MPSFKKPRSDSKVAALPPELRQEIVRRLGEANESYQAVVDWLADDGHRISITALCNWYSLQSWQENRGNARLVAEQVKADAAATGDYDEATLALVQERAYVLARTKGASVKELATLAGIIGDSAKLRLKQRELELNLEKFRQQVKTDIEKGLDALHAEIKGNAQALQLFDKFKAAILASAGGNN
jgi:hypothetical protein